MKLNKTIKTELQRLYNNHLESSRYSHSGTMRCDEDDVLLAVARRIADKLYKSLYSEYEYLTSNEAIIETIEANDYEFDQDTLKLA